MKSELLTVENLRTHFFTSSGVVKAVDGVSFSIERGGRLGIVGESGSGKSVTALSILRLVSPPGRIVSGKVLLEGTDLLSLSEERMREIRGRRISIVFQEPSTSLNPVMTIGAQIGEAIRAHQPSLNKKEREEQILESLEKVRLADPARIAKSYPHEISGGMRQRAMIAMTLSTRPDLLIADEPTTALDVTVQAQILELIRELQTSTGMALILITHDIGIIAEAVDQAIVMRGGEVVEQAGVEDLFREPQHPYTRQLLKVYADLASN